MVRRLLLALALGALVIGALAPVASAAKPEHFTETFEEEFVEPAGAVCDFEYFQSFTGRDIVTIFEDRVQVHEKITITHANLDKGYTLTEVLSTTSRSMRTRTRRSGSSGTCVMRTARCRSCRPGS